MASGRFKLGLRTGTQSGIKPRISQDQAGNQALIPIDFSTALRFSRLSFWTLE
jgi:hypothetical protein